MTRLTAAGLRDKWLKKPWSATRDQNHPRDKLNLRIYRALSWLDRAEETHEASDHDTAFIFYWIAFNALYGRRDTAAMSARPRPRQQFTSFNAGYSRKKLFLKDNKNKGAHEMDHFGDYIKTITDLDQSLCDLLRLNSEFRFMVKYILTTQFLYEPYWRKKPNWRIGFDDQTKIATETIDSICGNNVSVHSELLAVLRELFNRIYTLRNQVLHGAASRRSSKNREKIRTAASVMAWVVPHFVDVMIENPDKKWGTPWYPV